MPRHSNNIHDLHFSSFHDIDKRTKEHTHSHSRTQTDRLTRRRKVLEGIISDYIGGRSQAVVSPRLNGHSESLATDAPPGATLLEPIEASGFWECEDQY